MPDEVAFPFVSAIVPMRNERSYIERCLRSLAAQDYPSGRFEVIVVDGGSNDGSRELVESMREEVPNLRVVENRGKQTARGLNPADGTDHAKVMPSGYTAIEEYCNERAARLLDRGTRR